MAEQDMIEVTAVEGRSLPREDAPRRRVEGTMKVPNTLYYRRALSRGDIKLASETKPAEAASKKAPAKEGR